MGTTTYDIWRTAVAGSALVAALAAGCGAKVAVDLDGGTIGTGGQGGGGGDPGSGGAGGGKMCDFTAKGAGAAQVQLPECFALTSKHCPKQYDAPLYIQLSSPCVYLVSVDCGPVQVSDQCCYLVTEEAKPCN